MSVTSKIRRQGGAAVITLPPTLLKLLHLEVGAQLELNVVNGELVARWTCPYKTGHQLPVKWMPLPSA